MKYFKTLCFLLICCHAFTQSHIKVDSAGNYYQVKPIPKKTSLTYTDRLGTVYPVYESLKGKRFIIRIAKSGNTYTYYLPTTEKSKLN